MKTYLNFWMTNVLVLVVGLTGCATPQATPPLQPTATMSPSNPVVTETLAESIEQVKGLWFMIHREGAIFSLNGKGDSSELTYSLVWIPGDWDQPMDSGTAKFEMATDLLGG